MQRVSGVTPPLRRSAPAAFRVLDARRRAGLAGAADPARDLCTENFLIKKGVHAAERVVVEDYLLANRRPRRRRQTFLAHALGHIACRRGASVLAICTDQMLKTLTHARLDNSYEAELRSW